MNNALSLVRMGPAQKEAECRAATVSERSHYWCFLAFPI